MVDHPENDSPTAAVTPNNPPSGEAELGSTHKVGYGSPPLNTRFQKGVSGNHYGRPKRRPTADEMLLDEADRMIKVKENGRTTKMVAEQLIYANLVRAAVGGNWKPINNLLTLMDREEKKYGWDKVGWNKSNFWEKMNWKKEMEFMMTNAPQDTVAE